MALADLIKTWHTRDERTGIGTRRRTVGNWLHVCQHDENGNEVGGWMDADPGFVADSAPQFWGSGAYEFRWQSLKGAAQVFVGDGSDPTNRALVGLRRADDPRAWLNMKALGVNPVDEIFDKPNQRVIWPLLWNGCDLIYTRKPNGIDKLIRLRDASARQSFRFAFRLPDGYTLDVIEGEGGFFRVLDPDGVERFRSRPVHGWDSATTAPTADGAQRIRVSLYRGADLVVGARVFETVWITGNADDLAGAVFPAFYDPTAVITGPVATADTLLANGVLQNTNYGAETYDAFGAVTPVSDVRRAVDRIVNPSVDIPAGTITAATYSVFRFSTGAESGSSSQTWSAYAIATGNDWAEAQATWNIRKTATPWLGLAGCGLGGTDYDATPVGSLVYVNNSINRWYTISIEAALLAAWRDGTRNSQGIMSRNAEDTALSIFGYYSSEAGGGLAPYWSIDYTTAAFKAAWMSVLAGRVVR